jgi:hypothetical protein
VTSDDQDAPVPTGRTVPAGDHGHRLHDRFEAFEEAAIEAELESGRREETVEQAKRHLLFRLGRIIAGSVVCLAGLFLLVFPGPGLVVLAIGLAILAQDVPFARRLLDRVRARIPSDAEGNISKPLLYGGLAVSFVAVCGSLWWTFLR